MTEKCVYASVLAPQWK